MSILWKRGVFWHIVILWNVKFLLAHVGSCIPFNVNTITLYRDWMIYCIFVSRTYSTDYEHCYTVKPIWIQYVLKKPGDTLLSGQRLVLCCLASSCLIWDSCYLWYNVILHWIRMSIARCAQIWYSSGTLCNPITTSDIAYMGVVWFWPHKANRDETKQRKASRCVSQTVRKWIYIGIHETCFVLSFSIFQYTKCLAFTFLFDKHVIPVSHYVYNTTLGIYTRIWQTCNSSFPSCL